MEGESKEYPSSVPDLNSHTCQVWWARTTDFRPWHNLILNDTERKRVKSYYHEEDQSRFIIGCVITRLILAKFLQTEPWSVPLIRTCPFCNKPHGPPRLTSGVPHISISHSGSRIAVAFSKYEPVGVDVEHVDPTVKVDQIARDILTEKELFRIRALPVEAKVKGFLKYWTRKEAVLKATGEGLSIPPSHVTVSKPDQPPKLLFFQNYSYDVKYTVIKDLCPDKEYVGAISVLNSSFKRIRQFDARNILHDADGYMVR
ncbi:4'-phosphopantetheinyl transferase [Salibacterium salarium]|uniref:4'-phosphopantetheinyl transferase family protein n=1 Tax=Salibacterium salarium TaxID=284579 RepID=UPI002784EF2C|nr:4'-phosphopantetheinyl transferase superfamily protein [Salibacterium salarium]MDQ0297944.1 4'-phosphopantetheinyl transferase [Salibacterium salarium]